MTLVDSDVLICLLRGVPNAEPWFLAARARGPLSASVIAVTELRQGMRSAEREATERLLGVLRLLPVTAEIAALAGELGREHRRSTPGIGTPDLIVAATALSSGLALGTLNTKHYPMVPGLRPAFLL